MLVEESRVIFGEMGYGVARWQGDVRGRVKGACTGHRYRLDPDRPDFYVDSRDWMDLLKWAGDLIKPVKEPSDLERE